MLIVDASAIVALIFNEPEGERTTALIKGHELATSAIFRFELANVCLMKSRRQPLQRGAIMQAHGLLHRLEIAEYSVGQAEVLALAEATRLTHYDASYLSLSHRLNAPPITLDKALTGAITPPPAAP